MYTVLKSVISAGNYKLSEMQHKVKKLYATGDLTEAQMDELLNKTTDGASPEAERPETLAMLKTLLDKIEALDVRIKALETSSDSGDDVDPENPEATTYPAWEPWNGIDNRYQPDAIVTHNGQTWISTYAGQNVWEPGAVGTDALWKIYVEE